MTKKDKLLAILALGLAAMTPHLHAQHLNAGALGQNQNDKLIFANGADFAASSGYVKEFPYSTTGTYAGYYNGSISLTALPTTIANGGPVAGAPAPGSFIKVRMESVTGPVGSTFSFWDNGAKAPSVSLAAGSLASSEMWSLSDASLGAGTAGADPFGHIHGRRFTADQLGEYTVGFKVFETSVNGSGGGPIHTSSDILYVKFMAVPEPSTMALLMLGGAGAGLMAYRRRRADK
jgi:hypothetical protein